MQTLDLCVEANYLNRSYVGFNQCAKKTIVKLVQWFVTAGFKKFPGSANSYMLYIMESF